ncbi:hypothetical protein L596_027728 [Steinernema carpocapsae]|uniref:DNA-directed RNA polymerase III subunit RPC5 n=1 Tax=Steinernema carpocapsae TaxID=34508 RepID=A0A4U5LWB1_STECR|nr:hypothetical protein L596_027728 [Steinernema carpocapsae]
MKVADDEVEYSGSSDDEMDSNASEDVIMETNGVQEGDDIEAETDIILMRPRTKLSRVLIPQGLRYEAASNLEAKYKQKVGKLQMSMEIDCDFNSFDRDRMDDFSGTVNKHSLMTKINFEGTRYANKSNVNHVAGVVRNGKLYLIPVDQKFEMKRTLTHASQKNRNRNLMSDDSEDDEQSGKKANPVRVKFARPEDERQKKRREASSFHRTKVEEQDQWIDVPIVKEDDESSMRVVDNLVEQVEHIEEEEEDDDEIVDVLSQDVDDDENKLAKSRKMFPTDKDCDRFKRILMAKPRKKIIRNQPVVYTKKIDPEEELRNRKQPRCDLMKKSEIAALPTLDERVKAVLCKSLVITLDDIPVHSEMEYEHRLVPARAYARLVCGVWVAKSVLVFRDEARAPAQEKVRHMRAIYDFICCQFDAGNQVTQNDIVRVFQVSADDALKVLQKIGSLNRDVSVVKNVKNLKGGTWELRVPRDFELFEDEKISEIIEEEKQQWVERLEEILAYLKDKTRGTTTAVSKPKSTARTSRK